MVRSSHTVLRSTYVMLDEAGPFFQSISYTNISTTVTVGSSASMTCISYLFASNTNFEEVAQGKDGLIAVANFLGALFGGLLAGPMSDTSGRRKVLLVALAIMSIFSVLTAFANAPWSVILCRFLTGLGIGAGLPCVSALVAEHSSSNYRGFYSNYADSMWTVGFIYGAFLAWLFLDGQDPIWRVVFLLGISAPNVIGMVLVYLFVPESFRFLAIRGQHEEAAKVANRIARSLSFGGAPLEMAEVSEHYPAKSIHGSQANLLASWTEAKDAYAELYRTPENRRKILTAQAIWFLIHIGYGVAQWVSRLFQELEVVDNVFLNALIFSIGAVPGLIFAGVAVERVSRNLFLKGSIFATLASIAAFTILSYTSSSAGAIVAVSAIFHSCLMASWAAISLVTTEAFNTTQRSAALGMCLASGMLGVAFMNGLSALVLRAEKPIVLLIVGSTGMVLIVFAIYSGNLKVKEKGEVLQDA